MDDPKIARIWLREVTLLSIRWLVSVLIVLKILLAPYHPQIQDFAIVMLSVASNILVGNVMHHLPKYSLLTQAKWIASISDCIIAFAIIVAFNNDLAEITPAVTLTVLIPSAVRFHKPGVITAMIGSMALICIWASLHMTAFHVLSQKDVMVLAVGWFIILIWMAAVCLLVFSGSQVLRQWEQQRQDGQFESYQRYCEGELTKYQRERSGLSSRQWELLPLLTQANLTYRDIGKRVNPPISERTVGTHVSNMCECFDIPGGRWALVEHLRQQGFLADVDPS